MQCARYDWDYVNVDDIVACFHFLQNLGTQRCVTNGGPEKGVRMCTAGAAQVVAWSYNPDQIASSPWYVRLGPCCVCVSVCVLLALINSPSVPMWPLAWSRFSIAVRVRTTNAQVRYVSSLITQAW